jgi:zinc protease
VSEPTARPAPAPPRPYHFPPFTRARLRNGLQLLVAPMRRLPICTLAVVVDAGAELDPQEREGLSQLTARAVAEGTAEYPGVEFTERLERIGASLAAAADWDSAMFTLSVIADRLSEALALVAEVLTQPAFPETEVERLRQERLSEILQIRSEPRGLASETFARVVYTDDSRYAAPAGGTERSVRSLERSHLVAYHRARYLPERTAVIITGDVTPETANAAVEQVLGSWTGEAADVAPRRGLAAHRDKRVHVFARPDAPQSEIRVGHVGVPRAHEDYFPLVLMNAVLGGLFSSRINLNLREQHAYTYGAHSGFDWRKGAGPFAVRTAVESGVTAAAVGEIFKELRRMREEPVREEELSLAREYLAGIFPVRFETSGAVAAALMQAVTYDLPSDYYDTYRDRISAVTTSDVLRVARAHLDPERVTTVVVGDAAVVTGPLAGLGLGSVAELSPEDGAAGRLMAAAAQQPG